MTNTDNPEPQFNLPAAQRRRLLAIMSKDWRARVAAERRAEEARANALRRGFTFDAAAFPDTFMPANDNGPAWPIEVQLRRDGNSTLLDTVERYRAIFSAAMMPPPMATSEAGIEATFAMSVEHKVASKAAPVPRYRGTLSIAGAHVVGDGTGKAIRATAEDGTSTPRRIKPIFQWHGDDVLNARIDSRRDLARLRAALGPVVEVFEAAVLLDATLGEIGTSRGIGQHASGAGKALVYLGIETIQNEFRAIDSERRKATYRSNPVPRVSSENRQVRRAA